MRRRHNADDLRDAAVTVTLHRGLAALSFGAVAREAGVPDRTIVYYFPTKADLIATVLDDLVARFMDQLNPAIAPGRVTEPALLEAVWPVLSAPAAQPIVAVYLEACVRAARGAPAERAAAQRLAQTWLSWLAARIEPAPGEDAETAAAGMLARLDGALLLAAIGLPKEARMAITG